MNIIIMPTALKMTDLHTHILFGMDDGAQDIQQSLQMIQEQIRQGITQIVLTPHFSPSEDNLENFISKRNDHYKTLKKLVAEHGLKVDLKIGAEIMFTQDILSMDLSDLVIEDTNYLFLEFPTRAYVDHIEESMNHLINNGYDPIFAHIERYSFLREDLNLMKNLADLGILFQVNASSIIKINENSFVQACLKKDYIHLIGSDTHNMSSRKPNAGKRNFKHLKRNQLEKLESAYQNADSVFSNETVSNDSNYKNIKFLFGKYY